MTIDEKKTKSNEDTIGSKSLDSVKKAGVKFIDLFILIERLERNFSQCPVILPLDLSEILTICRNYSLFYIPFHSKM